MRTFSLKITAFNPLWGYKRKEDVRCFHSVFNFLTKMLFPRFFIIIISISLVGMQRVPPPNILDQNGLDPNAFLIEELTTTSTSAPSTATTASNTTTTASTTITTTMTTTTKTKGRKNNSTEFISRVAKAIKKEIEVEWTDGQIGGLASGVVSLAAFLMWLTYNIVSYVRNNEDWSFRDLAGHIFGLVVEHVTRIRPRDNHANQGRLDRAIHDNDANEARVRHTEV